MLGQFALGKTPAVVAELTGYHLTPFGRYFIPTMMRGLIASETNAIPTLGVNWP